MDPAVMLERLLVDHEGMNEEAVAPFLSLPITTSVASYDAVRNNR